MLRKEKKNQPVETYSSNLRFESSWKSLLIALP